MTSGQSYYWSSFIATWFLLVSEVSVLQPVILQFFTNEKTLPLPAWYPFDCVVS